MKRQQAGPVVFGVEPEKPRSPRNSTMSLAKSKFGKKVKEVNTWQDMTMSEDNMTAALSQFLVQMSAIPKTKDIERIVVGDLANGFYPLAVLTRGKETK